MLPTSRDKPPARTSPPATHQSHQPSFHDALSLFYCPSYHPVLNDQDYAHVHPFCLPASLSHIVQPFASMMSPVTKCSDYSAMYDTQLFEGDRNYAVDDYMNTSHFEDGNSDGDSYPSVSGSNSSFMSSQKPKLELASTQQLSSIAEPETNLNMVLQPPKPQILAVSRYLVWTASAY